MEAIKRLFKVLGFLVVSLSFLLSWIAFSLSETGKSGLLLLVGLFGLCLILNIVFLIWQPKTNSGQPNEKLSIIFLSLTIFIPLAIDIFVYIAALAHAYK